MSVNIFILLYYFSPSVIRAIWIKIYIFFIDAQSFLTSYFWNKPRINFPNISNDLEYTQHISSETNNAFTFSIRPKQLWLSTRKQTWEWALEDLMSSLELLWHVWYANFLQYYRSSTFREVEFTRGEVNNSIAALRRMPPNAGGNESRHSDSARASMRIV